ncbi:MAG TPA: serine hydrolase domain-containing protein [Puia sp.]|nr:serine hydrolase domain-containing protein [Puia sp.]
MSYKRSATCRRFSLFALSLLFCLSAFSQSSFDAVDQLLKQNQKAFGGGYAVVVWKDGKVVYQKQASSDFTPKMQAPIGRAGDWMTAALVMTFVDEGKLSLDDKVTQYIPLFGKYMKGYITIRNCLTNTTGIKTDESVEKPLAKVRYETLEDMVNTYANKHDIATNPGTEVFYSSLGPNIAGRVLEVISKKSFGRLMMDRIVRPCKMHGTSFVNEDGNADDPSNGGRSSANDYINFLAMLLNKGMFDGKRVLSEKAVQELETAQFASLPVKYMPKELQGDHTALGNYPGNAGGTLLVSPDLMGTAAWIDKCRNYAAVLIVEKPQEEKKPIYQNLINLVGQAIGGACE